MTDSTDKKSNEKRDNLDAMLDEAESSLLPMNEQQDDDEDTIDRLLMNAGFDIDDALMQAQVNTDAGDVENADLHDELDDFLGIDGFGEGFNEPQKTQAVDSGELEQTVESMPVTPLNESQDDEDAIDRLLMNAGYGADYSLMQANSKEDASAFEKLDDFSDFSDFNEPEIVPAAVTEESDQVAENLSSPVDEVELSDEADEFSGFDGFGDGFDESDLIQDDEVEALAMADLIVPHEDRQTTVEESADEDAGEIEALDDFSDFSDFNELEIVPAAVTEESEQVAENLSSPVDEVELSDEADEFSGFDGFGDGFDESDLIQDDEVEASAPAGGDLIPSSEDRQTTVEESAEKDAGEIEALDDFSDFSDFNEPEIVPAAITEESEQVAENLSSPADEVELSDEVDEFSGFGDDFDESDLIQSDEIEASAATDLVAPNEERQTAVEKPFNDLQDDENDFDDLFADVGFDAEDALEQPDGKTDELPKEVDDFSVFGDDFDESDLIQDDEIEASVPTGPNEEQQATVDESSNGLQDDEASFDHLFADVGFDAEETLEQTPMKKDEFGDDADLNDFFQLDEVSDDFSKQMAEAQLADDEKPVTQEDDFLLPDFDITADTDISDIGGDTGTREDEFADAFGDTDFLNEDETVQAFEPEIAELKSVSDETVVEATDTGAVESIEKVKLEQFEFEREEMQKQLEEAERKVKKAKLFSYVALGFGAVALSGAVGLGVMTYAAKSEVSKLTETVSSLEATLAKNTEKNPNEEINAVMNSVVQLNQQVYGFITELKEAPQFPVDLLNNKVPDIVAKQEMVSKALNMLQVKIGGEGMVSLESSVAEPAKVEAVHEPAPVKEDHGHEIAPVKTEAVPSKEDTGHKPASSKEETDHKMAPTKERAIHDTIPAKVEAAHETEPAKVKTQPEAVTAKPAPVIPPKAVVKEEPAREKRPEAIAKWGVNLVAFKQEWFAKSKAAEFARQGIFAEVVPVREKNTTMYRLRVGGFKTKAEANSNTARIKRTLNLDSVWVSDN